MLALAVAALISVLAACGAPASPTPSWPGSAELSVPPSRLDASLTCHGPTARGRPGGQPVLLVHGTGMTPRETWGGSYWPALAAAGLRVCWVELPGAALGDIQVGAEYVARAIGDLHRATHERVDLVTHSQGSLEARWAMKWFPSGRFVDDFVALGGPEHGTSLVERLTRFHLCSPACWQMRPGSRFLAALNRGDETPGSIAYTTISTSRDEFIRPTETTRLAGARNIVIERLCPRHLVGHFELTTDGAVYGLVAAALARPGPTPAGAAARQMCSRESIPGTRSRGAPGSPPWPSGGLTLQEPQLRPYAR